MAASILGRMLSKDRRRDDVCRRLKRTGLAARGSDEPTDALGGVLVDFDPWVGSIA